MFERTLQDLIRGLRAHKASSKAQEDAFLAEAMNEIRDELKGKDMALKAEGVLKVCYLMMLYPIPPPPGFAFHVVEVMSSQRYHLKQLGYLAAPMAFTGDTEEVVLTVNGIKKDLMSSHLALPPLPLTALPHMLAYSSSLSHSLHTDLLHLLTHSSPRVRKRAVLCLLPCWEAFPDGLREGFPRLREKLSDDDPGVVGATVGVVMELARRQGGKNYLPLAPELFGILTGSSNNWMLIKVVKLFAILTPLEPRLVRKLLPPITSLISSTSAISLLYECVRTCIVGGMLDPDRAEAEPLARVCVEKLGGYLRDEGGDQNLRYIALLAMVKIIPTHPHMIAEYQDEILQSLDDPDISIRMRALELVSAMVDRENLQAVVDRLLAHLAPPTTPAALPSATAALAALADPTSTSPSESPSATSARITLTPAYRHLLAQRILGIIAYDTYTNVTDFEWAVTVLVDVAFVSKVNIGADVRDLLLDIVGRVKGVRPSTVKVLERCMTDDRITERTQEDGAEAGLLEATIWVCGEYSSDLSSPLSAISSMLSNVSTPSSPSLVFTAIHAVVKIFAMQCTAASSSWTASTHEYIKTLLRSIHTGIAALGAHTDIEVQERANEVLQLLDFIDADLTTHKPPSSSSRDVIPGVSSGFEDGNQNGPPYPKSLFLLSPLFSSYELNAVAAQAQASITPPDGLNMDVDFVPGGGFSTLPDADEVEDESENERGPIDLGDGGSKGMEELRKVLRQQEEEDLQRRKGQKSKGKGKKMDGAVLTAEEKAEKAKRKAARRAKAQHDPYYLYDEKDDRDDDIDEIPIVRLDDAELEANGDTVRGHSQLDAATSRPSGLQISPDIDRTGEMPTRSEPPQPTDGSMARDAAQVPPSHDHQSSNGKDGDYNVDEDKSIADEPVKDIKVVRVKRKKKKDGEKRRKDAAE